jgi:hypothetical protein
MLKSLLLLSLVVLVSSDDSFAALVAKKKKVFPDATHQECYDRLYCREFQAAQEEMLSNKYQGKYGYRVSNYALDKSSVLISLTGVEAERVDLNLTFYQDGIMQVTVQSGDNRFRASEHEGVEWDQLIPQAISVTETP